MTNNSTLALALTDIAAKATADKLSRRRITEDEARASGSTENAEDGHVQFFTLGALGAMFRECSLEIIDRRALSFVSGPIVKQTLGRSKRFVEWNARIADRLPMAASSAAQALGLLPAHLNHRS